MPIFSTFASPTFLTVSVIQSVLPIPKVLGTLLMLVCASGYPAVTGKGKHNKINIKTNTITAIFLDFMFCTIIFY
jgi:hypothetical protein